MQAQKVIELLGYSTNEAKVYLATLSLGECQISDIATKTDMPRTTVQVIVDKLAKDGLMHFYVMRQFKYWIAEHPDRLLLKIKKQQQAVQEALPTLTALRKDTVRKKDKDKELDWHVLRVLADSSIQPMLITTNEPTILYVNISWEKQFGYSLEEVRGENPRILQSGKTPREVYVKMWEALKAEKIFQSDEIIDKRNDGTFFTLLTTIMPVRHNSILFYIQILDDVTEKKRVEELRKKILKSATA